jgi:hypothetical protein
MESGREAKRGGGLGKRINAEIAESVEFAEKRNPRTQAEACATREEGGVKPPLHEDEIQTRQVEH